MWSAMLTVGWSHAQNIQLRPLDGFQVRLVCICRDLDSSLDAAGAVFHELHCPSRIPAPYKAGNYQLTIGINSDPRRRRESGERYPLRLGCSRRPGGMC